MAHKLVEEIRTSYPSTWHKLFWEEGQTRDWSRVASLQKTAMGKLESRSIYVAIIEQFSSCRWSIVVEENGEMWRAMAEDVECRRIE
jgi:hypothetical protein